MAFSITCPHCGAKLKTATAIDAGRQVQCPKCKSSFPASSESVEEISDKPTFAPRLQAAAAPPARTASAASAEFNDGDRPARNLRDQADDDEPRSRKRDDDNEDDRPRDRKRYDHDGDRPRSRRRDDDDRPSSKRRDDDEEDRPRSRKRNDDDDDYRDRKRGRDDDDDDRPRSRRRNDDDDDNRDRKRGRDYDDDDKPRSRRRDEERNRDDDDDGRPIRRRKKKKGGSNVMLFVIIGSVVALAGIGLLIYFLARGSSVDKEMLSYMPADATTIKFVDVAALKRTKYGKLMFDAQFTAPHFAEAKAAGLSIDDIDKVMTGTTEKGQVVVIRFRKSIDKGKLTANCVEQKTGDKSYYKPRAGLGQFLHFPSDDLIVGASTEDLIKSLAAKETGKVVISESMKEVVDLVAKGNIWNASSKGVGMIGMGKKAKAGGMWIDMSDSSASVGIVTVFESESDAKQAHEDSEKMMTEARRETGVKSVSISRSGKALTMEISGSTAAFEGRNERLPTGFGF